MKNLRIGMGSDHAGFELKEYLRKYLTEKGYDIKDVGCYTNERCDYPDFAHLVARDVTSKNVDMAILSCGSGNGINMAANRHKGVRSALCWNVEIAKMARLHNDANILTLPGRYISEEEAKEIVNVFVTTEFEGGRHAGRVEKIENV